MLFPTQNLLQIARENRFAIGAFNIYNLEGATAVIQSAEKLASPVILQMLPSALELGGSPLIALCLELARQAEVPVGVHLDHCSSRQTIELALKAGLTSIMADGSHLDYEQNIDFVVENNRNATRLGGMVEAELGRLSGEEDGLTVDARQARMTDPDQAVDFVRRTSVAALAVCIGNVHGKYNSPPDLDFDRLSAIEKRLDIPLVLHGTSGLPDGMIVESINRGVCKFNVNTEVRTAYMDAVTNYISESLATSSKVELVHLMRESIAAMGEPVQSKLKLFCSADKAQLFAS